MLLKGSELIKDSQAARGKLSSYIKTLEESSQFVNPAFKSKYSTPPEPEATIEIEGRGKYSKRNTLNNLTGTEWI